MHLHSSNFIWSWLSCKRHCTFCCVLSVADTDGFFPYVAQVITSTKSSVACNDFYPWSISSWPHFYQTRSAWSKDQGSNENHSHVHNFAPTVTKFCVMWEGQALPQDTKFGNCRDKIVDSRAFLSWSLILGLSWSGLIKLGPGHFPCLR